MQNNKIKNIYLSYWFKELNYNPMDKINELEDSLKSIIDSNFMYNEESSGKLISMPRIQGLSKDKKYLFNMSLISANLSINIGEEDIDDVILLINNNIQLVYDILKEVYNLDIIYSSIKIEMINDKIDNSFIAKKFNLTKEKYEDLSLKRGFIKDDYYINYMINSGKEINFNINKTEESIEQDLFDRTMLVSLADANLQKEFIAIIIDINDRYSYNCNPEYRTSKDNLRGMILELKDILSNEKYFDI